jgi:hypothetical protein
MPGLRNLVRALVGAALGVALVACAVLPVPEDLPAVALEQAALYRLEVGLAAFYGCLLLATPAYSGLAMGRLPIEISTRGARFAEETERAAERDEARINELEQKFALLREGLERALAEIRQFKSHEGDKT